MLVESNIDFRIVQRAYFLLNQFLCNRRGKIDADRLVILQIIFNDKKLFDIVSNTLKSELLFLDEIDDFFTIEIFACDGI